MLENPCSWTVKTACAVCRPIKYAENARCKSALAYLIIRRNALWVPQQEPLPDHTAALDYVLDYLRQRYSNNIKDEVEAMGHRVVHGKHISEPVLVDDEVMRVIKEAAELAPLHNPANLQGIVAASAVFPGCPQVGLLC